ncbi:MAG: PAS domain S-box protein, partial [Desulfomonile tiedjei]|nr:PAS domain S-box protein [Desulfomonile tiedjei]
IGDPQEPLGVHGTARDITDRKRAEDALRESQEKYRLVVDNAKEAILVVQDMMLKFVNPRAMELSGYTEEELKLADFTDFVHPDDRAMVAERYARRMSGEYVPSVYPFRIFDRFGNIKWAEITAIPVKWDGKPATLNFVVDITARRRLEEELVKIQKLESLGILAGGIAHDFNNILTVILGNISLARMHAASSEETKRRLKEAEKGCLQAQGLTQQLLTFSKGGAPIRKAMEISHLIKDSCHFAVRGSNVRCEFSLADNLSTVEIDDGQIGQVINNLVINAVHSMPQGGVIGVGAENVTVDSSQGLPLKDRDYLKIVVRDHGVGIPQNILPRIFDPYFTTKQKGSGLGLATAYSIVKNHEGLITVESVPSFGTVFHVYLPASKREAEKSATPGEVVTGGAGRILVMDDEDSIRVVAAEMLSTLGYDVQCARDGYEAIQLYRFARAANSPFDVVILDLTVPGGMGGAEAIRKLLEIDPGIKAVVSSGYSNDPIMASFNQYGFCGVVAKPYTSRDLSETLTRVIFHSEHFVQ